MRHDLDQRHRLQEALADARLEAGRAELPLDVGQRLHLALGSRSAALELIRRDALDVGPERGFGKCWPRRGVPGRNCAAGDEQQSQRAHSRGILCVVHRDFADPG